MTDPNQPDNPIDRALAALRSAAPPAGMEDRILQRLDARLAEPQPTSLFRSAWLRGALTGALAATAVCAALFFIFHAQRTASSQATAAGVPRPSRSLTTATPVALPAGNPCPGAPSIRDDHGADGWDEKSSTRETHASRSLGAPFMHNREDAHEWEATSPRSPHLLPASFAPSHPAPPAPLTAQERALIELTRKASPAQLAALNPATEEKADAERQTAFDAFFAPSAEVRAIDEAQKKTLGIPNDESAAPNSTKEGTL